MTEIHDVIADGDPIPGDVTGVEDREGDAWQLEQRRGWYCLKFWFRGVPLGSAAVCEGLWLSQRWGPLTVTAVREEPKLSTFPEEARKCPGCGERPHPPLSCVEARDARAEQLAEPEPQQADASPVLDLVRQYGDERNEHGHALANPADGMDVVRAHSAKASALFDRIAALVPQQPVQARDGDGMPLWMHLCGYVEAFRNVPLDVAPFGGGCDVCDSGYPQPGDWRPLLVGGDPAPEGGILAWTRRALQERNVARAEVQRQHDLIALVMAELGVDRPEDVLERLSWLKRRVGEQGREFVVATAEAEHYLKERDEARAEVERLSDERDKALNWRDQMQENAEAWRQATDGTEVARAWAQLLEARAEVERLETELADERALRELAVNSLAAERALAAAQPDPLVLSLSEVPEGTEALTGLRTGVRYPRMLNGWGPGGWPRSLSTILTHEHPHGVRVELAPPCESRTAAEVWIALGEDDRDQIKYASGVDNASAGLDLARALDREAGL